MTEDPFKILGVERSANDADIKRAFRKLAKQFHPDHNPGNPDAEKAFKKILSAYEQINNTTYEEDYAETDNAWAQERTESYAPYDAGRRQAQTRSYVHRFADFFEKLSEDIPARKPSRGRARKGKAPHPLYRSMFSENFPFEMGFGGWLGAALLFFAGALITAPRFSQFNDFFGLTLRNDSGASVPVHIIMLVVGASMAVLNKMLFLTAVLAGLYIQIKYEGQGQLLPTIYLGSYICAGGLIADGFARAGGGNFVSGYEWSYQAPPIPALFALFAFCVSGALYIL